MRNPAVAGSFYPSSAAELRGMANGMLMAASREVKKMEKVSIVCPHAGYIYSGATAACSFASCANFSRKSLTAIVIGPNHTGMGAPIAVSYDDWKTPLGEIKCDAALADAIVKAGKVASRDEVAHLREHSSEVQLPFLQLSCPTARAVCICMGYQEMEYAAELGKAIFDAVRKTGRDAIVVASSDFTHYESEKSAMEKDKPAIARLVAMDEKGFEDMVDDRNLSICGHGPIAAAMSYSKLAGAKKCELLKYTNSGDATGDHESVVSYASLAISK